MSNILKLQAVSKIFKGLHAVDNVSFTVNRGEILGLIGPNGAGKTTLFNLVSRFLPVTSGRIFFKDHEITSEKVSNICRKGIARTFQIVQPLLDMSVLDNVLIGALYGKANRNKRNAIAYVNEVLEFTGMYEQRNLLARNLGTPGRKRLELARAMATDPELLLLDEVMAGLTPTEVDQCIHLISKINETGITIIMVEHVMQAVMNISKRIVVLDYGKMIAEGTPKEICSNPEVIRVYLGKGNENA